MTNNVNDNSAGVSFHEIDGYDSSDQSSSPENADGVIDEDEFVSYLMDQYGISEQEAKDIYADLEDSENGIITRDGLTEEEFKEVQEDVNKAVAATMQKYMDKEEDS